MSRLNRQNKLLACYVQKFETVPEFVIVTAPDEPAVQIAQSAPTFDWLTLVPDIVIVPEFSIFIAALLVPQLTIAPCVLALIVPALFMVTVPSVLLILIAQHPAEDDIVPVLLLSTVGLVALRKPKCIM